MNRNTSLHRTTLWPLAACVVGATATGAAIFALALPPQWSGSLVLAMGAAVLFLQLLSRRRIRHRLGGDWEELERLLAGADAAACAAAPAGSLKAAWCEDLRRRRAADDVMARDVAAIAGGVGSLSAQTTELALSLQIQGNTNRESRESVRRIDESIQVVAALARETETDARQVSEMSHRGEQGVEQAAERMQTIAGAIDESSRQVGRLVEGVEHIGGIANIIEEIAGQTNLLALNAAIEAARAGEQGRGFAVVADEVRKLAERTAKATAEITAMIGSIQADTQAAMQQMEAVTPTIRAGLAEAERAADVLRQIKQQAGGTLEKMGSLTQALAEEGVQAREMVARVEQMVQVSEKTEAMIRDASSNSAALEKDVERLQTRAGRASAEVADNGRQPVKPLLTWNDALSTGVAEIDEQHKQLIAMGNRLNEAIRSGQGRKSVGSVLDQLIDYTARHFRFEEALMDRHGYRDAEEHKGRHRRLVEDVLAHKARFEGGEALSAEVMNFIRDWLVNHIMKTDKAFGRELLRVGAA